MYNKSKRVFFLLVSKRLLDVSYYRNKIKEFVERFYAKKIPCSYKKMLTFYVQFECDLFINCAKTRRLTASFTLEHKGSYEYFRFKRSNLTVPRYG